MKAIIQTLNSTKINRDIDIAESPMSIIRSFYEDDPTSASQIFTNQTAIEQMMNSQVDETKSTFELIATGGDSIRAEWKRPLCDQPAIKEELANIEAEGQVPVFVVGVSSIVAGTDRTDII